MSDSALKSLSIEHLRGSIAPFKLPFDNNKKLTVVYGENGTGKSTICDAFEFLGKGWVGSLDNRGLGSTNRYWHSVGKTSADIVVTLETQKSKCTAKVHKNGVICHPPESRPHVEVLRRSQILSLIEATPAKRYEAISRFIDVAGAEASEAALKGLIDSLRKNRDVAVAQVQENRDSINQFWETAGSPGGNAFVWAEMECKRDIQVDEEEARALKELGSAFTRLQEIPARLENAASDVKAAREVVERGEAQEIRLASDAVAGAADVLAVLEAAQTFFHRHTDRSTCPVCESTENITGLPERIAGRLAAFAALRKALGDTRVAKQGLMGAEQRLQIATEEASRVATAFEECRGRYTWPEKMKLPAAQAPSDSSLADWLKTNEGLPAHWKKGEDARVDRQQFVQALRKGVKTWQDNTRDQKEIDALLPKLELALKIAIEERRRFTDEVLSKIAVCVGELYEAVHQGEGLSKISLELDPKKKASLEFGTDFHGTSGAPPQAYFSDSHLDTLGLCVFLAMAQMDRAENTILVLDDVLASVDEPHVERLIEMLHDQALKFHHCVITTHYRPWKMKLRWGWLKSGQCNFIELSKWNNDDGMAMIRTVPDLERLRTLLTESTPDAQMVCAKAGFILEAALNFITLHYECKVARKPEDRYTLGDLLPAIDKKLRGALSIERKTGGIDGKGEPIFDTICLAPIIDELTHIAQARNVFGCHFNALSFELLEGDALRFGRNVLELMECLTDHEGGWPRNGKSGKYWATSGETRRLSPYKRPE